MTTTQIVANKPPAAVIVAAPYAPAGPIVQCTSNETVAIIGGSSGTPQNYTFTVNETGLGFLAGMRVRAAAQADNTAQTWVEGGVVSFDGIDIVIAADLTSGSGSWTGWNIQITGQPGKTGPTGATGAAGPQGPAGGLVNPNVVLTGTPTCPTAGPTDVSLQIANTTWIRNLLTANYQPLDSDLTSLAAAATVAIYYRKAAGDWEPVVIGTNMAFDPATGTISAVLTGTAPLNSPAFTGDPTRITPPGAGDSDLSIPTTGWVQGELVAYAKLANPSFTGTPQTILPAAGDSSDQIASTGWVQARLGNYQPLDADLTALAAFSASGVLVYRKGNGDWQPVAMGANMAFDAVSGTLSSSGGGGTGGGIEEAPGDSKLYGRINFGWAETVSPVDLIAYAKTASPSFSGVPLAPTAAPGTSTQQLATTAFVAGGIAGKANTSDLSAYAPLASPALTGSPTSPTPTPQSDSSGRIATTSFVAGTIAPLAPKASPVFTGDPQVPDAADNDNDQTAANSKFVQRAIALKAVRFDAAQSLTLPQKGLALANIGAAQNNLINGILVESHAGNAATYAIKTLNLDDPSAADPVLVVFADGTVLAITAALSLTIPSGATLGTANGIAFRLWFMIINDAGTPRLVVRQNYATLSNLSTWSWLTPRFTIGTNAISSSSAASGTNYAAVATTARFRVVAFSDYDAGLATAGAWAVAPTRIMLVNHQTPMPGSVLSAQVFNTAAQTQLPAGGGLALTALALNASLTSPANLVRCAVSSDVYLNCAAGAETVSARVYRSDTTPIGVGMQSYGWAATVVLAGVIYSQVIYDKPNTTAATLYRLCGAYTPGNASDVVYLPWVGASMELSEIMM